MNYFGVYNYLYSSHFIPEINTIIDTETKGCYKHEIIHYLFSGYKFNFLLSEGLATYLSGWQSSYLSSWNRALNEIKNKIKNDPSYALQLDAGEILSKPEYAKESYLIAALLLYKYQQQVGKKQFFKSLFEEMNTLADDALLKFFKQNLHYNNLSDYLLTISETEINRELPYFK